CSSCRALYTRNCGCSKGSLEDKILVPCLNEGWYTIHDENEILNTSGSSNHNTNVVSAPREPFVFNQDPGVNSSQSPLQSNHNCCFECGDSLDGIFCQRCTCKSCGNGAHIGYNCPPKAPIISNSEQCNQTINELPQTLPSVYPTCNSENENSFTYDSKPNFVDDSPNVFNPPPQPPMYSCEFCGNNARYEQAAKDRYWKIPICYDDDEDYTIATTPVLSTKEPVDSLIMGDEHLDTIPEIESDEIIKSSVENLVPIPSEFEGIFDNTCDVPVCEDPSTFYALKDHSEILSDSNDDGISSDDDDFEDIEYVSLEKVHYRSVSLPDYEAFNLDDDHIKEKSSGSTTTHADFSLPKYDSFIFDLSINPFPPADRSDFYHEEFADELAHIISPPDLECFYFKIEPDPGDMIGTPGFVRMFLLRQMLNLPIRGCPISSLGICCIDLSCFSHDCPDFEESRAHGFVHSYIRASYPQLHLGNLISKSY
ncbi:hypothetical protein Tco_1415745, partial [Tanacetum coccineum]